ncbi:hemagglutinin repeat-containing protein [Collimonas silvisoli]|uniref:hemagglutinin repeat-containing protein n=1 Tax=Collimonas silvisoli TaxID=2825884 RepID=UPI0038B2DB10
MLAKNDINIVAKSIDINTAANTGSSDQSSADLKIGAFARVSSPLIDLGNNLENAKKSDGRLQAMQGLAAAANGYQIASAANAVAGGAGSGELLKAEVGVGFASANSQDRSSYNQAQGSSVQGGGNVSLTSTAGDIHATGAHIAAGDVPGKTLTLDSARNILLDAGQSTATSSGSNHSAGVEVGVGYEVGAKTGFYAYVSANVGNGNYNNSATTNSNTQLSGDTVTLKSQGDTTLKGATVKADTINADVGGKLAIESVQDTSVQHNEQSSVGGRVQISFGTAWEASGNVGQSTANGSSNAVNQQSGLFAGNGGYHVTADTVALKGGAIASSNAGKSDLTAKSITFENLTNKMDYSADTVSMSGGVSGGSSNGNSKGEAPAQTSTGASNPNVTPGIPLLESGSASSTTYGTLTDGNITIGGQRMTSAAGLGAHTDLATAHTAIAPLPDLKNVMNNQQAMAAAANTVIATSAQIGNDLGQAANKQAQQADAKVKSADADIGNAQAVLDNKDSTEQQKADAQQALNLATENRNNAQLAYNDAKATADSWGPTGSNSRALKVVTGILVGGVAGQGAGQLAANASAPYVANAIGDYFAQPGHENQTAQVLTHAVLGAILAAANGSSAAAGAGAGASGELAAQVLTRELYPTAYDADGTFHPEKLDTNQINTVIALSTAVGALVAGATGGSALDANVGASIAANAVTNNWLSKKEKQKEKELSYGCFVSKSDDACKQLGNLQAEDDRRNKELANVKDALKEISGTPAEKLANQLDAIETKICQAPSDCSKNPDWLAVDQVFHYARSRAQGLEGVYPEQWALMALGAFDLTVAAINGAKYLATEQFAASGSAMAIGKTVSFVNGARVEGNFYRDGSIVDIAEHFGQFQGGASLLAPAESFGKYANVGRPDGLFVSTNQYINKLLAETQGNNTLIKQQLGIEPQYWNGPLVRIDIPNPLQFNPRLPSGLEGGANSQFMRGGYTPGSAPEITINSVPVKSVNPSPVSGSGK